MVWYGMVWYGMVWYGMVWYGMVCYGVMWFRMMVLVWCDVVSYGMVFYGMVLLHHTLVWYMVFKINQSLTSCLISLSLSMKYLVESGWENNTTFHCEKTIEKILATIQPVYFQEVVAIEFQEIRLKLT
jgi:hypothetical protein